MNVNHYPAWGVLKPGGAFEISHGKNTMNDVLKFTKSSLKAKNMWALSAEKVHSIMKREKSRWYKIYLHSFFNDFAIFYL